MTSCPRSGPESLRQYLLGALLGTVLVLGGCGGGQNSLLLLDELPDVASITIEGNEVFDDGELKGLMTLRGPLWWNPFREHKFRRGQIDDDVRAILTHYLRAGYLRVREVDRQIRESSDGVHILIRLSEGEPVSVRDVTVRGARAVPPRKVLDRVATRPGEPLDPFALQEDKTRILALLGENGFWEASVRSQVQFFGNEALVFYSIIEGDTVTVREVLVGGHREVRERNVRREISVEPGEPLKLNELVRSQTRLLQSGYFLDAAWDTVGLDTTRHEVSVGFLVRERRLRWFEMGLGLSSQDLITVSGEWGSRNFLKSGVNFTARSRIEFDIAGRLSRPVDGSETEFIWNLPHILGTRWELQPSLFYEYDRERIDRGTAEYEQSTPGVGISTRRRFGDLRNEIVFTFENRWVFNDADSVAQAADPQLFRESYTTRLFRVRLRRDTRNEFFSPTAGERQTIVLESAGGALGGNNAFRKGTIALVGFRRLPRVPGVFASRILLGLTKPSSGSREVAGVPIDSDVELIPPEDRFYMGGAYSVRGFNEDELDGTDPTSIELQPEGGLVEMLVNLELRYPIFGRFSGAAFLDAGQVWQDRTDIRLESFVPHGQRDHVDPTDFRYTYGLGLRFDTPVGPIRLDYARKWNIPAGSGEGRDKWHVAIAQAF